MMDDSVLDVLIVDDVLDVSITLSAMLNELANVKISVVVDGQEALTALASNRFDILFLDLQLPLVSGEEILDAIAADGEDIQKPTHIIVMSAGVRLQELQTRLSANVIDGSLEKPFQYADLQGIIADVTTSDFLSGL